MLPLLRGLFVVGLALTPSVAAARQIWIYKLTGSVESGQQPNGYRFDRILDTTGFGTIEVFVNYTRDAVQTYGLDAWVNGLPAQFSCGFTDNAGGGTGSCQVFYPFYACGKFRVLIRHFEGSPQNGVESREIEVFIYDSSLGNAATCLPQCDSCQLTNMGQGPGKPVNVATGKLWYRHTDLALSGPLGLTFSRWYDSRSSFNGDLAVGWRHSYGAYLDVSQVTQRQVAFWDEEGRPTYFNGPFGSSPVHDQTSGSDLRLAGGIYTLTTWDNRKYTFDSAGRLASLTDRIGNTQSITRDGSNRIDFITDPLGRVLDFTYDASNKLISATTSPLGLSLSFGYTGANCFSGNLCSATMPDGKTWTYEYTSSGNNLTKVVDPLGHAEEENTYTAGDKLWTQKTEGNQNTLTFNYPNSTTTTVSDGLPPPNTRTTTYTYDPKKLVVTNISGGPGCACGGGESRSFTFDQFLRKTSETDGLGETHTIRWTYGRDIVATYPDDFTDIVTAYPSPTERDEPLLAGVNRTTSWTYYPLTDPQGMPEPRRDLVQTETVPSVDTPSESKITTLTFNPQGLLTSRQEQGWIDGSLTTYTTNFSYDGRGRLQTVDGPRLLPVSDVTTYTYYLDSETDLAKRGQLHTVTDAANNVTTYAQGAAPFDTYTLYGQPRSVTDPNGVVRVMTYDNRGRLAISTLKGVPDDPDDLTTSYEFDDAGRLTKVTLPGVNGTSGRNGTSYVYDGSNRLTDTIRFASNGNQHERLHLTFNVMSEKILEEAQSCNAPAPACAAWTTRRSDAFRYDGYGRLWQINHPDSSTIYFTYDAAGNLHDVRDENPNHTTPNTIYEYDLANRLKGVKQTLLGAPNDQILTSYGYDVHDNLNSVTDPNTNLTTYLFDDFRRMRRQTSPVTGVTNYTHDPAGNLLTLTDANSATTTRTFDDVNRVLTAASARAGFSTESVTFTYDDATAGNFGKGRLASMTDPSGSTAYAYERRGLVRSESRTVEGNLYAFSYAYDGNGNRRQIVYPSYPSGGLLVNYTFDFADRPLTASNWVTSATYRPFGPVEQIRYANGTTKTMSYDNRYRPTGNKLEKDSPPSTLADYGLVPDPVGNIDQVNDLMNAGYSRTFEQDDLNRLTRADSGGALWVQGNHAYDRMGNITSITLGNPPTTGRSATFTYVEPTPKIAVVTESGIPPRSVSYDAAGNETAVGTGNFTYSPRNYLSDGEGFSYKYDGRGVRTVTVGSSGMLATKRPRRYHFYSPELNLLSETFLSTATVPLIQTDYVWFAGQPVGQIDYGFFNTLSWSFTDHLGTPFIQTDSSGAVVWRAEYEPYGRIFALRTPNHYQPLRLPGQEAQETNLLSGDGNGSSERFYNVFRWYRFRWGRYSQGDPLWRGDVSEGVASSLRYYRARYYDPNIGRFLSPAPIGYVEGPNLYRYVHNNPANEIDPEGLAAMKNNSTRPIPYKPEGEDYQPPRLCQPGKWCNVDGVYSPPGSGRQCPIKIPDNCFGWVNSKGELKVVCGYLPPVILNTPEHNPQVLSAATFGQEDFKNWPDPYSGRNWPWDPWDPNKQCQCTPQ